MDASTTIIDLIGTTTAYSLFTQGAVLGLSMGFGFAIGFVGVIILEWKVLTLARDYIEKRWLHLDV